MRKKVATQSAKSMAGAIAIVLCYDLWMSRKGEDVMSLDAHYIDEDWEPRCQHMGLVDCSQGTGGLSIAKKTRRVLKRPGAHEKCAVVVKVGGANLETATRALRNGVDVVPPLICAPLGGARVSKSTCWAHGINGAGNAAVRTAKTTKFKRINVKAALEKLQKCVTYSKKSSKGWLLYVKACELAGNLNPVKCWTLVKTRFTSWWKSLPQRTSRRAVVHHMFSKLVPVKFQSRNPTETNWMVAKVMQSAFDTPCRAVTKTQDTKSWFVSDAVHAAVTIRENNLSQVAYFEDEITELRSHDTYHEGDMGHLLNVDLLKLELTMNKTIAEHLSPH